MKREAYHSIPPPKDGESASSALSAASPGLPTPCRHVHNPFRACRVGSRTPSNHQALCFHIVAHSLARRKTPTPVFSDDCALFGKNTRGGYPPLLTAMFPTHCALTARHSKCFDPVFPLTRNLQAPPPALNPSRALVYHARRNKIPNERLIPCFMKNSPVGDSTHIFRRPHGRALEVG